MHRTRLRRILCILLCGAWPVVAHAQAGSPLAEPSADAALAGAVTARPGDTAAIARNPGALGHVDRPVLTLGAHAGEINLWMARDGEGGRELDRGMAGAALGLVARLPGPDWLARVRVGLAAHLPTAYVLRLSAPPRPDEPTPVAYGYRAGRTAVAGSLGVELPYGVAIGGGVSITPSLETTTYVSYDATRGDSPDDNVVVDARNELVMGASPMLGARYAPIPVLAFGLAWRGAQVVDAEGPNDVRAGAIRVDAVIDFHEVFAPMELAFGVWGAPVPELALSGDVVWSEWSTFRTIHDRVPSPAFDDVVSVRLGAEVRPAPHWTLRAGWAFEPTPVPEQRGVSNYVDSDRHVLGIGAGIDLERLGSARVRIDVHARFHVLARRSHTKDTALLPDAHDDIPGLQIDNRGYPGFESGGSFGQIGITVTAPLSREGAP
jgi:long-chain fatty acid transport protein